MTKYFLTVFAVVIGAFFSSSCLAQGINWQSDLEQASQQAARENKLVLLHFGATWCRPCHTLDTFVFSNPRVQRAMQDNVIPVKIDVDEQAVLAKEYGVSSVPFDVVITPAGRVVGKRSSPRDASAYADMINGFNRIINGLANGNPALHEQLDQLKDQMFTDNQIVENKSFEPAMPVHRAPNASRNSAELKRKSRIINPFTDNANQPQSEVASEPKTLKNSQLVQSSTPRKVMNPMAFAAKANPIANKPSKNNDFASNSPAKAADIKVARKATVLSPARKKAAVANLAAMPSNQTVPKELQPKSATQLEPQTSPAHMTPAKPAENSFAPQQFAATPVDFQADNSANTTPATDFQQAPAVTPAPQTKLLQMANQTGFLPADKQAIVARPIATAKLRAGSQLTKQNSVSASLVIPRKKPVNEDKLLKDEKAAEMEIVSGEAKIILEAKSNDFASTATSNSQAAATDAPLTNSTAQVDLPENIALHGKCPITLMKKGIWTDGDPKWGCIHRNRTYLFTSEANMREFQKDPDASSPLLAGYDPVIFHNSGELVDGMETHGVFMGKSPNQRVVLFSSAKTRSEFESSPRNYIETIRQAMQATGGASSKLLR
jgi:thioredoxin-like negative regulator of GroEL/YHS domain-containing protein